LAEYKTNEKLKAVFRGSPYVTLHMSAKERNEYNNFRRGNDRLKGANIPPKEFRPMGFNNPMEQPLGMFGGQSQFGYGFGPQMGGYQMVPNMRVPLPA
jgi:hypothetical protein